MFLFKRGDRVIANTGQTFRSFLKDGFEGERASVADWVLHLNTLFPEVRLKSTLEVRSCDVLPPWLLITVPALYTGLLYDERALSEAEALGLGFEYDQMMAARPGLVTNGIVGSVAGRSLRELAERIVEIAAGGLSRRARLDESGRDEGQHLAPLISLIQRGLTPADVLREGLKAGESVPQQDLLRRALGNG
jgi:glutamate--cysteine ligase